MQLPIQIRDYTDFYASKEFRNAISDPTPESYGSELELAWKREKPIKLNNK